VVLELCSEKGINVPSPEDNRDDNSTEFLGHQNKTEEEPEVLDTIFSRQLFSEVEKEKIDNSVEDKLMQDHSVEIHDLIKESANRPMQSYLATVNGSKIGVGIVSLAFTKEEIANKLVHHKQILGDRITQVRNLEVLVPEQETKLAQAKARLELESWKLATFKTDLQTHRAEIARQNKQATKCERDIKVVDKMGSALVFIRDAEKSTLPYANVNSRSMVQGLAATFGVTDRESVLALSVGDHCKIANATHLYGYRFSEMFASTGLQFIWAGKRALPVMQEQTCRLFLLHAERTSGKRRARDVCSSPEPSRKRAKTVMSPGVQAYLNKRTPSKSDNEIARE